MTNSVSTTKQEMFYIPIFLESLRIDSILNFDLYLNVSKNLILYRSADLPFTEETRQKLLENKIDRLYITSESKRNYQIYIEKNLSKILLDQDIKEEKKAGILYETSTSLVREILDDPSLGENVQRSKELVVNTVEYILKGREAFLNLLKITSVDYYTYTHSVNVCTFVIALAQQLGFNDEQFLHELGVGALLHDVGKSKISERILNKRTALNPTEFEIMKKHPQWGVEILSESNEIEKSSYYAVLQHHERGDGSGYPHGITLDEMHIYGKLVAIADVFDAMTTSRAYQGAMDTFPALKIMLSQPGLFDEKLLSAFIELMGPKGLVKEK